MIVEIYTGPGCGYCDQAKRLLSAKGYDDFIEIDARKNIDDLKARITNLGFPSPQKIPQIFMDGEYVGGYDQLVKRFAQV